MLTSLALIQVLLKRVPLSSNPALSPSKRAERRALERCQEAGGDLKVVASTKGPLDFSRLWSELVKGCWPGTLWWPRGV